MSSARSSTKKPRHDRVPVAVRAALAVEEQRLAIRLRREGFAYDEIAERMNVDEKRARRLVYDAMNDAREQVAAEVAELRALEVSRLDALLQGIWAAALAGQGAAIDRALKIMERRAKMLGLDVGQSALADSLSAEEIALEAQAAIARAMATMP